MCHQGTWCEVAPSLPNLEGDTWIKSWVTNEDATFPFSQHTSQQWEKAPQAGAFVTIVRILMESYFVLQFIRVVQVNLRTQRINQLLQKGNVMWQEICPLTCFSSTIHRFQDRNKEERGKEGRKAIIYLDSTLFKCFVLSIKFPTCKKLV